MSKGKKIVSWVLSLVVGVIYLQTLFFKFTGVPESIFIFEKLAGAEFEAFPRIGTGIVELVTALLIIIPRTRIYGALLSVLVIAGAIFSHLTVLGVVVNDDGGSLFALACIILVFSVVVVFLHKSEIPLLSDRS